MGNEGAHQLDLSYKVHSLLCFELKNLIDRVSQVYSEIESARPRCSTGLKALCLLVNAIYKAKLLIQHCSECSKLYLAFTAERILLRCENIRTALDLCLGQIQNMVPALLAAKISGIIQDLRGAKFQLESSEAEAGEVIKALLKRGIPASDSVNKEELEALQFAAVRLKITFPFAVQMEKRFIKRLYDRVENTDTKKQILEYLLYLLRKYAGQIGQMQAEDNLSHQHEVYTPPEVPLEFKCPISMRIMFDPVVIASGKTYERVWIEKWFCEGNVTCPITDVRLDNFCLTPNVAMKSLISKWSSAHGIAISEPFTQSVPNPVFSQRSSSLTSIASIGSSMMDLNVQVSNVSIRSSDTNLDSQSFSKDDNVSARVGSPQMNPGSCISLPKLDFLTWESQRKVVQDVKAQLEKKEQTCDLVLDKSYMKSLIKFLKNAHDFGDVNTQNDSADVLLLILRSSRIEVPPFDEDAIYTLASFLDSEITGKALAIIEKLSCQPNYKAGIVSSGVLPSILKVLDTQNRESQEQAMKILFNLSCNNDIAYHILYLGCIAKLVPFLGDQSLADYCLAIMHIICDTEEGKSAIAETNSCIAEIATLVETGTQTQQEIATQVLRSLSYEHKEQCLDIIKQKPSGLGGLGQILAGITEEAHFSNCSASSTASAGLSTVSSSDSGNNKPKRKKLFGFLGRKLSRFFLLKH